MWKDQSMNLEDHCPGLSQNSLRLLSEIFLHFFFLFSRITNSPKWFLISQSLEVVQIYVCVCVSCSVMFDSLWPAWTVAHQAPLSMGFPRKEYWSGLSFPPPGKCEFINLSNIILWKGRSHHNICLSQESYTDCWQEGLCVWSITLAKPEKLP